MRTTCEFPCKEVDKYCGHPTNGRCGLHPVGTPFPAWYVRKLAGGDARAVALAAQLVEDVPLLDTEVPIPVPDLAGERNLFGSVGTDIARVALGAAGRRFGGDGEYLEDGLHNGVLSVHTGADGGYNVLLLERDGAVRGVEILIQSPGIEKAAEEKANTEWGPEPEWFEEMSPQERRARAAWWECFRAECARLMETDLLGAAPEGEPEVLGTVEIDGHVGLGGGLGIDDEIEVPRGTYAAVSFQEPDVGYTRIGLYSVEV